MDMNERNNYHRAPQDDLPYEQQMKHIIEHYRWLLDQNGRLAAYARSLEKKVEALEKDLANRAAKNMNLHERFVEKNRECKRLKAHIEWLNEQLGRQSDKSL